MEGFGSGEEEQRDQPTESGSEAWRDLATRLEGPPERVLSLNEPASPGEGAGPSMAPERDEGRTIDSETLYELAGEEVVSVLKAAHVAAERIRSKAEGVAAQVQQDIAELQRRLAHLSAELGALTRGVEKGGSPPTSPTTGVDVEETSRAGSPGGSTPSEVPGQGPGGSGSHTAEERRIEELRELSRERYPRETS